MIMVLNPTRKVLFALTKELLLYQKLIELNMSDQELVYLNDHYNPLQRSDCNGIDIYIQVKYYITSL